MSTTVSPLTPQGDVIALGIPDSQDYPRLVYCAPYFQQVPLAELIEPSVQESVEALLPSLVPPYVQAAADAAVQQLAVLKTGSTMSGPLMLAPLMPTADSMAATKAYVDAMVATAGVPEVPLVPTGQTWARQTGQWVPISEQEGTFLPLAGGTMQGQINMSGYAINNLAALPNMPNGAAPANWVLQQIASVSLYQGTWNMDTYVPDLTNPATHVNGYTWIAITASTSGVVIAPPIPGLQGLTVFNGDTIIWSNIQGQFNRIHSGGLSLAEAQALFLPFTGGTMTGPLLAFENPTEAMEVATMGWVQSLIPTGGIIPAPPNDGQVYGRNGLTASWLPVLPLAGGVMTGAIMLAGNATNALSPVPLQQLTSTLAATYMPLAGGTMTGPLVLSGNASANLNPVPLQQLNAMIGSYLPLSGGNVSGSLGVGGAAAAGMVAGGLFASQQVFSPGYGLNTYLNTAGTGWVHMNTNVPATINSNATGVLINVAPAGAAGSAATGFVSAMAILPSGNVNFYGNVTVGAAVNNSLSIGPNNFYITDASTYRVINFQSSYQLQFRVSDGQLIWQTASAPAFQCDYLGNFQAYARMSAPQMTITGGAFGGFPAIYWSSTNAVMAYNASFYWIWNGTTGDLVWETATSAIQLRASGDFYIGGAGWKPGGGVWADSSDIRIKRDVVDYQAGLAELMQLRPVEYSFNGLAGTKDDGKRYRGLVAQECGQVMPELVGSHKLKLHSDDAEDTDILTVDSTPLTFALINAVCELASRVQTLEARA